MNDCEKKRKKDEMQHKKKVFRKTIINILHKMEQVCKLLMLFTLYAQFKVEI